MLQKNDDVDAVAASAASAAPVVAAVLLHYTISLFDKQ